MDRHAATERPAGDGGWLSGFGPARLLMVGELPEAYRLRIGRAWPESDLSAEPTTGRYDAVLVWGDDLDAVLAVAGGSWPPAWVHTRAAGIDPELAEVVATTGITLTTGSGAHGAAVAEHVVAMVLAQLRRLPELVRAQQAHRWHHDFPVRELGGMLAGIVGVGDLGRCTARLLRAFGARVRGLRRVPDPVPEVDEVFGPDALADFLAGVEVLVVAAPLTPRTSRLIGAAELARLDPGCLVVNVGRGPIIDTPALVAALGSGQVGGAALDVFEEEPLPPESPLWSMPNVLISPHCADLTRQTDQRSLARYLDLLRRFRAGTALPAVDPVHYY